MFQSTPSLATILKVSAIALVASMASGAAQAGDLHRKGGMKDDGPVARLEEPVYVEKAADWTGPYIAIGIGYGSADVYLDTPGGDVPLGTAQGARILGRVGFDYQIQNFVVGAFGEGNYHALEVAGEEVDQVDFSYCAGVRGGPLMSKNLLLYATAGYCWLPIDDIDITAEGIFVGGGVEFAALYGFGLALEGRYTMYSDDKEFFKVIDARADDWSGLLLATKKF